MGKWLPILVSLGVLALAVGLMVVIPPKESDRTASGEDVTPRHRPPELRGTVPSAESGNNSPHAAPDAGQLDPILAGEQFAQSLRALLDEAPSDTADLHNWLKRVSEVVPGGLEALLLFVFLRSEDLTTDKARTISEMGWYLFGRLDDKQKAEVRSKLVGAFLGMSPPSVAKWDIGLHWMAQFKVRADQFPDKGALERLARLLADQNETPLGPMLAQAAARGARSDALRQDLLSYVRAGIDTIQAIGHIDSSLKAALPACYSVFKENAHLLREEFVDALRQAKDETARYVGTLLLMDRNPGDPRTVVRSLYRYRLPGGLSERVLVKFAKQYGEDAMPHLPSLLEDLPASAVFLAPILSSDARRVTMKELPSLLRSGRAVWDPERAEIALRR